MTQSRFVRWGGLASILSGLLLASGQVLVLASGQEHGPAFALDLILVSHIAIIFAIMALYAAQAHRVGILGQLGAVLGVIGTTLIAANVYVEIAAAAGVDTRPAEGVASFGIFSALGAFGFLSGLVLFAIATVRAGVFPRWAGLLLIVGAVLAFLGGPLGVNAIFVAGGVVASAGFIWLGWALFAGQGETAEQSALASRATA